jgi:hypothetical protein
MTVATLSLYMAYHQNSKQLIVKVALASLISPIFLKNNLQAIIFNSGHQSNVHNQAAGIGNDTPQHSSVNYNTLNFSVYS